MDSDLNIFLNALRDAINDDPNQFNRAKNDSRYDAFRPQVDALLDEMYQEVKKNAEKEYRNLDYATLKMKNWFNSGYSSSDDEQKYKSILKNIIDAKCKIETYRYPGYVEALKILYVTDEAIEEIQSSIKKKLEHLRNSQNQISNELNDTLNEINEYNYKRKFHIILRILIIYALFFIFGFGLNLFILIIVSLITIILSSILFSKYMENFDFVDKIIGSIIIFITLNAGFFIISQNLSGIFLCIIVLVLSLIPVKYESELSTLYGKQKNLIKQNRALEEHIEVAKQSLIKL